MENGKRKPPGATSQGEPKGPKLVKKETEVWHAKAKGQHVVLTALTKGGTLLLCAPEAHKDWNVWGTDGCLSGSVQNGIQHRDPTI